MFISRKKLEDIEGRLLARDEDCCLMKKKIEMLECAHTYTQVARYSRIRIGAVELCGPVGFEECKDCGKVIRYLDTESDIREHEISKVKQEVSRLEDMPPET